MDSARPLPLAVQTVSPLSCRERARVPRCARPRLEWCQLLKGQVPPPRPWRQRGRHFESPARSLVRGARAVFRSVLVSLQFYALATVTMAGCCVPQCTNHSRNAGSCIVLEDTRFLWTVKIKRDKRHPKNTLCTCSVSFRPVFRMHMQG